MTEEIKQPELTPLDKVTVCCCDCKDTATLAQINEGEEYHHDANTGRAVRFPTAGLTERNIQQLKTQAFRCECCHEEYEEANSTGSFD